MAELGFVQAVGDAAQGFCDGHSRPVTRQQVAAFLKDCLSVSHIIPSPALCRDADIEPWTDQGQPRFWRNPVCGIVCTVIQKSGNAQ